MNQGLKFKLLLSFAMVFLVFAGIQAYQFSIIYKQVEDLHELKDKTIITSHLAAEAQLSVVQVQQWLTDISATRATDGYDDGFVEAEKSAQQFKSDIEKLIKLNPEKTEELRTLGNVFNSYYTTGIEMANAYIQGGPQEGNQRMVDFDKYATDIHEKVEPLVEEALAVVDHSVESMEQSTNSLMKRSLIIFMIILIICTALSIYLSRQIVRPISSLVEQFEKAAQGDLTAEVIVKSRDELGNLGNSFNKMLKNQREVMQRVLSASQTVAVASTDLSASIQQTSAGLEEITAAVVEISSGLQQNAASAQETNTSTSQMAEVARAVEENTVLGKERV
jgi:methyl-accepting chemotaxis protein